MSLVRQGLACLNLAPIPKRDENGNALPIAVNSDAK